MPFGQIFNQGVRYIKVNRFDSGGLDRSDYLGQLTNLTITYDDLGPIQYNIVTTQEQNDYFVYGIETRNQATQSVNYNVFSQSVAVESTSSFNVLDITYLGIDTLGFSSFISGDTESFNLLDGQYIYQRTPNDRMSLVITASYNNAGSTTNARFSCAHYNNDTGQFTTLLTSPFISVPNGTGDISYEWTNFSEVLIEQPLVGGLGTVFGINSEDVISITNFKVKISQSQLPVDAESTLIIFEPEFIDFDYNDYNPLLGNAETPQYSTIWMDVDYSQNPLVPVNFGLIISGTANRAFVQDSNYSSKAWSNLRYNGSRTNSYRTI
jgi:hypothetical protein